MRFTFRVRRHPTDPTKDVITDARYLTFGCTSAIASSEALCALIKQREYTPIEALKIQNHDIVEYRDFAEEHGIRKVPMDGLLREADIVSLHVPLDESTREMIAQARQAAGGPPEMTAFLEIPDHLEAVTVTADVDGDPILTIQLEAGDAE